MNTNSPRMKKIIFVFLVLSFSSHAQSTHCDSVTNAMNGYNTIHPNGSNLWTFIETLSDSLGTQHYDSGANQNINNTALYWITQLQRCGLSCPAIVSCSTVSRFMSSFLLQYPSYDSIAPTVTWSTYLNQNGAGTDVMGITNWWYTPDEWQALLICCELTPPLPASLGTHCDTIQTILGVIPGVGTATFNQNNLVNELNSIYENNADLAFWFPQLLACGDSCSHILACDSFSSAMSALSSYGSSGPYSVPFSEAYLGVVFPGYNTMDTTSWNAVFSCCQPSGINFSNDTFSHCEQVEYLRILLQSMLPTRSCLPAWMYNFALGVFVPQLPAVKDSNVYQLCADLTTCKVTCLPVCDDSILTTCDSVNSVAFVYRNLLAGEGLPVDTSLLDNVYSVMFGQSLAYSAIISQIGNCNPNDTAVLTKIVYMARNVQYTTSGTQTYLEFDLFATDTPTNLLFSQSNIFVQYDSTIFGTNLVGRGAVTATKGNAVDSPYYNLNLADSTNTMLKIAITHSPNPVSLTNLDSVNQQLCHLKINLTGFNLTAVAAAFDTIAMSGRSKYQQTPTGLEFPYDIIKVNGLVGAPLSSIDSITYQIVLDSINPTRFLSYLSDPDTIIFDIQVRSLNGDYIYDADPVITYNTNAFGTNVCANGNITCSSKASSAYYFLLPGDYSTNSFQIHLDADDPGNYDLFNSPDSAIQVGGYPITIATCKLVVTNCCAGAVHLSVSPQSSAYYGYVDYSDSSTQSSQFGISLGAGIDTIADFCSAGSGPPYIDSISPTTIAAGTFSVLTIYGKGFGCTPYLVYFNNSDDGGASRIHTEAPDIQLWQDNEIQVWVPSVQGNPLVSSSAAGSGQVVVSTPTQVTPPSTQSLTIPYAVKNIRNPATLTPFRVALKNPNIQGAYIFRPASYITGDTLAAITKAMNDWKCQVGVRFIMGPDTNNAVANNLDNINTILFAYLADTNVLCATKVQTTYPTVCSADTIAVVSDIDMVFNTHLTTTSFDIDTSDLVNVLINHNSLLGVARHEFGHAVCLQHVIEHTLMYYSDDGGGVGIFPEQILIGDQDGGLYELLKVGPVYLSAGCYLDTQFISPCPTLGFHLGINNISDNPFKVLVYPNPISESITIHANLSETENVKVSIFDVLGQLVGQYDFGSQFGSFEESLNVSLLSRGLYLVRVSIGDQMTQVKLIKK